MNIMNHPNPSIASDSAWTGVGDATNLRILGRCRRLLGVVGQQLPSRELRLVHPQEARLVAHVARRRRVRNEAAVFAECGLRALVRSERLPEKEHRWPFSLIVQQACRNTIRACRENAAETLLCSPRRRIRPIVLRPGVSGP